MANQKPNTAIIGIYKITSPSGKVYIGQSWSIKNRFREYHKPRQARYQRALFHSLNKYGVVNHSFEIIYRCTPFASQHKLDCLEQFFMDWYRSGGTVLLNIREAGSRGRLSEDTKKRMSNSLRGKAHAPRTAPNPPVSAEHRMKLSLSKRGSGNPFFGTRPWNFGLSRSGMSGKTHSDEARDKQRLAAATRQRDSKGRMIRSGARDANA